jgi:ABC-type phosphate transport system substrate-binding protein
MMIRRRGAIAALIAVLFVAGCANSPGSAPAPTPSATPTVVAPSASTGGTTSVSGTVSAGVEPHCLLLTGEGASYQLIFSDPALRSAAKVGASIIAVGTDRPAQVTTCQQGIPFVVTAITPN